MKLSTGMSFTALAAATAFLLGGCADPAATAHVVHLGHDAAQSVDVAMRTGQHLAIVDDDFNASIGDGWSIVGEPDPEILRFDGEGVVLDDPQAVGGGGIYSFDYVAVGAGTTTITVEYSYRGDVRFESVVAVTVD